MTALADLPDRVILALLIWGEARGEDVQGQIAVGNVVRNRLKRNVHPPAWKDICLAPFQFSCFNATDPNAGPIARAAVTLMTSALTPGLAQAQWIADGVMSGACLDNVHGATHYLTTALLQSHPPVWAVNQPTVATIGAHTFLKVA